MTARRLLLAVYWAAVALTAAVASLAAALPFDGCAASRVGVVALIAVCAGGIACAPAPTRTTRKEGR